jgi:hypothetical protein
MKVRALLIVFCIIWSTTTLAAISSDSRAYSGASRVDTTTNETTHVVYGGTAGSIGTCTDDVCDSCANAVGLTACNRARINPNGYLTITFKSDSASGYAMIVDPENTSTPLNDDYSYTTYSSNSTATVNVLWSKICQNLNNTSTDCSIDGEETFTVGISGSDDSTSVDSDLADSADDTFQIQIKVHGTIPDTATTGDDGLYTFELFPGDKKVYLKDVVSSGNFPNSSTGLNFQGFVLFYQEVAPGADCTTVTAVRPNSNSSGTIEFDSSTRDIKDDRVSGDFENGSYYIFKISIIDEAGNIGYFTRDDVEVEDGGCVASKHVVVPSEVAGLLAEEQNCFIATAAYGSKLDNHVQTFRDFRDSFLLKTWLGKKLVSAYYRYSPPIADAIAAQPLLRATVRTALWPAWGFAYSSLHIGLSYSLLALFTLFAFPFLLLRYRQTVVARRTSLFVLALLFTSFLYHQALAQEEMSSDSTTEDIYNEDDPSSSTAAQEAPPAEPPYPDSYYGETQTHQQEKEEARRRDIEATKRVHERLYQKGLRRITKDGVFVYEVQSSEITGSASLRFAPFTATNLSNPVHGWTYDDIYGGESNMAILVDYEWDIFRVAIGRLGLRTGIGFASASGNGRFVEGTMIGQEAMEVYTFYAFPISVGLVYRLQFWDYQFLVPYASGGADYYGFAETRDDGDVFRYGGAATAYFGGGIAIMLDALNKTALFNADKEYGVNHMYLVGDFKSIIGLNTEFDFTDTVFSGGVMVDF